MSRKTNMIGTVERLIADLQQFRLVLIEQIPDDTTGSVGGTLALVDATLGQIHRYLEKHPNAGSDTVAKALGIPRRRVKAAGVRGKPGRPRRK
jgi:hypothetical protein